MKLNVDGIAIISCVKNNFMDWRIHLIDVIWYASDISFLIIYEYATRYEFRTQYE